MNTHMGIDGTLMEQALALSGLATMGEAQEDGLRLLARMEEQEHIRCVRDRQHWIEVLDARARDNPGRDKPR
jgi:hypothetical protein